LRGIQRDFDRAGRSVDQLPVGGFGRQGVGQ
jgi:hypothetical protein